MAVTFDGKEFPVEGPTVPKGTTALAKRLGPRSIRTTGKRDGKELDMTDWEISPDGKVLTQTEHDAGVEKATISVFDRQ